MSLESRAKAVNAMPAELIARLTLYPTEAGGRESPFPPGLGCLSLAQPTRTITGWDGWPQLDEKPMHPGETRTVGFVFLSGREAAEALAESGKFYLWENRTIGEAEIIEARDVGA
jgi:hypothetical protein